VGASVASVVFTPAGIVVGLRRRRTKLTCPCGWKTWAVYDRRTRRWRHLDLAGSRLWLEAEIRRLDCGRCRRVRTEVVPWARPGARHSRDSKTWWRSSRSQWTRRPSPSCCGSAGRRWPRYRARKGRSRVGSRCGSACYGAGVIERLVQALDELRLSSCRAVRTFDKPGQPNTTWEVGPGKTAVPSVGSGAQYEV
jgi:zinc-finger of transposase IS204/IS1001/IS1096/IS1165